MHVRFASTHALGCTISWGRLPPLPSPTLLPALVTLRTRSRKRPTPGAVGMCARLAEKTYSSR